LAKPQCLQPNNPNQIGYPLVAPGANAAIPADKPVSFGFVGYGRTGTGESGASMAGGTKRVGVNTFDDTGAFLANNIQSVGLTGAIVAGSTFKLTYNGNSTA
jgi:hypothetical protein